MIKGGWRRRPPTDGKKPTCSARDAKEGHHPSKRTKKLLKRGENETRGEKQRTNQQNASTGGSQKGECCNGPKGGSYKKWKAKQKQHRAIGIKTFILKGM